MADMPDSALQGAFASPFVTEIPPAAVMRLLSRYERKQLAGFIAVAIDLLDLADGDTDLEGDDPDLEPAGDELDHSWPEWQTRGRRKVTAGGYEMGALGMTHGIPSLAETEDDEEDDPAGQYDEDYYTGPAPQGYGPGCLISDSDYCEDGI